MSKDKRVAIKLCIRNNLDYVKKWLIQMRLFNPDSMKFKGYKEGKFVSYNETIFVEQIDKEIINTEYSIFIKDGTNSVTCLMNNNSKYIAILTAVLDYDLFVNYEDYIYEMINNIIIGTGVVGRIVSLEDNFWQNNIELNMYSVRGKSLDGVPLMIHPILKNKQTVDTEKMAGQEEQVANIWFGATWKMWFNDSYYKYVSKDVIENFEECYKNESISDNSRCITLYEDLFDYENIDNRKRQWEFKKAISFKETVSRLKDNKKDDDVDSHMEIINGKFEHGGTRMFKYYLDDNDCAVSKSKAFKIHIKEFDENTAMLWESIEII